MLVDIHVHTSRYSACGKSSPEAQIEGAIAAGMNGIVFTEHDLLFPRDELDELQAQYPAIRLFRGAEYNAGDNHDYLVIGIPEQDGFHRRMDPGDLVRRAHAYGAAVVVAHPFRYDTTQPDTVPRDIDAVEILSNNTYNYSHGPACRLAADLDVPAVATSDSHQSDNVGLYALQITADIDCESKLARAIRSGEFSIHVDRARVASGNEWLRSRLARAQVLADDGLSEDQIVEQLPGLSYTALRGLLKGYDVLRPGDVDNPVSPAISERLACSPGM